MKPPLVSVLMTVLDSLPFVGEAIASILDQTFEEFELIIVDDGSHDGTWDEVVAWLARDARVVARRNPETKGTSRALNQALALARGEFITRQDGDDRSVPERLALQVGFLRVHPEVGALATAVVMMDGKGNSLGVWKSPERNDEIQQLLLDRMCLCGPTLMIRRQALQRAGFRFDEELSYSEDYDLCLRLAEVTELASLGEPLYMYRQHAGSVSRGKRPLQMLRKAIGLERALRRRFAQHPPELLARMLARDYFRAAVLAFASGDRAAAMDCRARALHWDPAFFDRGDLVGEVVERYVPRSDADSALRFVERLFAEFLPPSPACSTLKETIAAQWDLGRIAAGPACVADSGRGRNLWSRMAGDGRWLQRLGAWPSRLRLRVRDAGPACASRRDAGKDS